MAGRILKLGLGLNLVICLIGSSQAQTFYPDRTGHVSGPEFLKFIKAKGYQLVSAFDTLYRKPVVRAAKVMSNHKWIMIDTKGNIIDPSEDSPPDISGGFGYEIGLEAPDYPEDADLFETVNINGKIGTVNKKTGLPGLNPIYQGITLLGKGLAKIRKDDKVGLATSSGKIIKEPNYDDLRLTYFFNVKKRGIPYIETTTGNLKGLLSLTGEEILPTEFNSIRDCANCTAGNSLLLIEKEQKYGLATTKGKVIVAPSYRSIYAISPRWPLSVKSLDGKSGFIDSVGTVILTPIYDEIRYESDGKYFKLELGKYPNTKYGIANLKGKVVLNPEYAEVEFIKPSKKVLIQKDQKFGLADVDGRVLISPTYDRLFMQGSFVFATQGEKQGVLNANGKIIFPFIYDRIGRTKNGFIYQKGDKWATMDLSGSKITPLPYEEIVDSDQQYYYTVKQGGKYGVLDADFKPLFPIKYDRIYNTYRPVQHGIIDVSINGERGYADRYGNEYLPASRLREIKAHNDNLIHTLFNVDKIPTFLGEPKQFVEYIKANLRLPEKAKGAKGTLYVKFVIEKDGSIGDVESTNRVNMLADAEVFRVIKASPKWKPATKNGNPVRVVYNITFDYSK